MARGDYGFNGSVSAEGFGTKKIRIESIVFGLGIIANEDEARRRRVFYPVVTTGSSFTMTIAFISYDERTAWSSALQRFAEDTIDGILSSGVMTIRCPSRDFLRTAVLDKDNQIEFGEGVGDMKYTADVSFCGASDPTNLDLSQRMAGISYFSGPKRDQQSQYFYPGGRQIKGAEDLDGAMFDPADTSGESFVAQPDNDRPGNDRPYDSSGLGGGI